MENKYDLTFPQQNIWLVNSLYNNSKANLITGIININKDFNVDYCKEAINNIIKNNDAMRINIVLDGEIPYQVVKQYQHEDIDIVDMQNFSKIDIDKYINKYKKQDIDILSKKLFEFKILKYKENKGAVLLKMHHIISDAWSYSKIIEQFVKYYTSLENNDVIGYIEVPGYIEFVNTTLEYKNGEKYKRDEEFWSEYLSGFEDKVTLKDRIKNINNTSSRYNVKLKKDINDKILEYCKENRISPYVMFLAALSTYMYRIKDKNDFVIGTPSLNRANFKEKQMIGMFVSTLPLRVKIQENEKFLDVAHDIARNTMSIFRHQKYPYINTLKNVRGKNNTNNNLYGIILSYQNARAEFEDKEKYDTKWYENDFQNEDLQIHILDMDSTGTLEVNYDYLNELFDEIEIEYLHTRIMAIIEHAILNKEIDVENIEIMSKEEKDKLLYEFNDTKVDYPKDKSVIEIFEEQVEKTPDNIALVFEDKKITYKELNEKANSVAHYLIDKKQVKPNDIISIKFNRSIEMIVAILGVSKTRAAYLPLDPTFPEERIEYIKNNSKSKFILDNLNDVNFCKKDNINIKFEPSAPFYVLYTSGSTGTPKGVVINNKNILNFVYGINKILNITDSNNILSITTVSFDIFELELWLPILNGAKMILASDKEKYNSYLLNKLCIKNNVDVIQTTPSVYNTLLFDKKNSIFLKYMQKIILGGEKLSYNLFNKLRSITNAEIYDGYGPTETTIYSSMKLLNKKISVGLPTPNTEILIKDKKLRTLPIGIPGELCIAGDGVADGYLYNDDLTKESFINMNNKTWYKTGDLAVIDFNLEANILDRIDFQIKVNGQRVEVEEIEKIISEYPNINNCVVSLIDNKLICFYNIIDKSNQIKIEDLSSFLYQKLPVYMVPKKYYLLENIPMSLNGKIDRKKISNIEVIQINEKKDNILKPKTEIQKQIYDIWKKIITNTEFGINDSFFELGTDSLDAIKLQVELLSIGIHIEYKELLKCSTIISLEQKYLEKRNTIGVKFKDEISLKADYSDILSKNSDNTYAPKEIKINNVLLTGATGFLGAHVLNEYMEKEKGNIYCIVRSKNNKNAEERLKIRLNFYFGDKYDKYIGNRIIVIDTDILNEDKLKIDLSSIIDNIDFVIHTAACVKHYGDVKYFKDINIEGTKIISKICFENKKKLIHTSTISISGNQFATTSDINPNIIFDETCFYKNQNLENIYVYTKFKAEQIVLDYMKKGMQANIMRIGNLTNRYSDLKFQYNKNENAFFNRIKTFINLKIFPESNKNMYLEFTPVDCAACAVLNIMKFFNKEHNVFHIYNNKHIYINEFLNVLEENMGISIKILKDFEFSKAIENILNSPNKEYLNGIINDLDDRNVPNYNFSIKVSNAYTVNYLRKIGFEWPNIDKNYIIKYINSIK